MKLWSFKPTEFLGVGCRLAVGLAICTYVGYFLFMEHDELDDHFKSLIRTFFKWAAVTVVVTTQPLTGRVAEICIQRVIGTVAGGCVGFVVAIMASRLNKLEDEIFMTFVSASIGFIGAYLGWLLKLETSARLFSMTYLLVAYGVDKSSTAEEVAITRTGGIVTGVLVSMTMSVLIFPNSATDEAIEKMRKAVGQLGKLNELAWAHAELAQNPSLMQIIGDVDIVAKPMRSKKLSTDPLKEPLLGVDAVLSDSQAEEGKAIREVDILQKAAEGVLAGIYKDLDASEGLLAAAKQEILIPIWHGRWCFVPGNPFCICPGQWVLPKDELSEFSTTLRRVARLIWTLHTTFVEGFDETMAAVLEKQYPKPLFPLLIKYSTDFVNDVVASFPYKVQVPEANLIQFEKCVEALHCVSDYQRRRIIKALKHYKKKASLRRSTTLAARAGRSAAAPDTNNAPGRSRVGGSATPDSTYTGALMEAAQNLADQCLPTTSAPQPVDTSRLPKLVVDNNPVLSPPNRQESFTRTTPGSSPTAILLRLRDLTAIDIQPPTPTFSEFTETPRSRQQSFSYAGGAQWSRYRSSQELGAGNLARTSYSMISEQGDANPADMPDDAYGSLARRSHSVRSDQDPTVNRLSIMSRSGEFDEMFQQDLASPSKGGDKPGSAPGDEVGWSTQPNGVVQPDQSPAVPNTEGSPSITLTKPSSPFSTAQGKGGPGFPVDPEPGLFDQLRAASTPVDDMSTSQTPPGQTSASPAARPSQSDPFPQPGSLSPTKKSSSQLPPLPPHGTQRPYSPPGLGTPSTPDASPDVNVFLKKSQQITPGTPQSSDHGHPGTGSSPSVLSPRAALLQQLNAAANATQQDPTAAGTAAAIEPPTVSGDLPPIPEDKSYADLTLLDKLQPDRLSTTAANVQIINALADVVHNKQSGTGIQLTADSSPCTSDGTPPTVQALEAGLRWKLPRVSSLEVSLHVMFPDTEEGYIAKVRWYSFQFLMEELADEFRNLHSAMLRLIPKLPHHKKKRRKA